MQGSSSQMLGLVLTAIFLTGCGELDVSTTYDTNASGISGRAIKERYLETKLDDLAGKQVFFKSEDFGSKPLGVNFYKDGTWRNDIGNFGNYTVNGTTVLVVDQAGLEIPHVFTNEVVKIEDVAEVPSTGLTYKVSVTEITTALTPEELVAAEKTNNVEPEDAPDEIDGYKVVGFGEISDFKFEVPDDPASDPKAKAILEKNEIPETVRALDKKNIAIKGYMLPLRVEEGLITEFLVMRDQSACCFGAVPKINEWISVRMPKGKGVKPMMDVPIYFFGTLKVGEVLENDYLVGIYEMDGHKIGGPL
ncbi:MAG: DUF3299 domain-containing protein [Verrucomicrobiota bacterium]|jgi:hypothetical protein|nr:DUF3299 domain-containing protein [Verrucomicrobiota bacterium]